VGGGGWDFIRSCIGICKELNSKLSTAGKAAIRPSPIHNAERCWDSDLQI
jgi:hypothetical protein